MATFLGLLIVSFIINGLLFIPFINFLYGLKFQRQKQNTKDAFERPVPIFDKFHRLKAGTPVGGGILMLFTTIILFLFSLIVFRLFWVPITSIYCVPLALVKETKIILFTFVSFGLLGLYDDIKKMFYGKKEQFFGLKLKQKLILEIILGLIISYWLFFDLKIDFIYVPFIGVIKLSWFYIPLATFILVAFSNAFNITDGLDGLSCGILMIGLLAFWFLSATLLDTPLSIFIAAWLGAIIAFLYFNVYPARIFLGDVGALSFGATLAVIGLLLGKVFTLLIVGGVFIIEAASSLLQLLAKRWMGKKLFKVAPFHLWLQERGWEEPKIVLRFWLGALMLSIFGLWIAFVK